MADSNRSILNTYHRSLPFKKLKLEQIEQIDDLLTSIGEYGEVHLVVERGELKYINLLKSHKANQDNDGEGAL